MQSQSSLKTSTSFRKVPSSSRIQHKEMLASTDAQPETPLAWTLKLQFSTCSKMSPFLFVCCCPNNCLIKRKRLITTCSNNFSYNDELIKTCSDALSVCSLEAVSWRHRVPVYSFLHFANLPFQACRKYMQFFFIEDLFTTTICSGHFTLWGN